MFDNQSFSEFINNKINQIENLNMKSGLISICTEIPNIDLFKIYEYFLNKYSFSAIWEEQDNMSFVAFDKCKYVSYEGPDRFKIAKNFNNEIFSNLVDFDGNAHNASLSKVIYFFSFSNKVIDEIDNVSVPIMEAILPKILIINDSNKTYLRMNFQFKINDLSSKIVEEYRLIIYEIIQNKDYYKDSSLNFSITKFNSKFNSNKKSLIEHISKGIKLIEDGILEKIVICTRINFILNHKLNLIQILKNLKFSQNNSCIYLWHRNHKDITFGGSPEKLFSIKKNSLILEAIAGSTSETLDKFELLKDKKNLREHQFVVNYLIKCLKKLKINNFEKSKLKVTNFGNISHLHTLIYASIKKVCPFDLLKNLHPSPAVCGVPKNKAIYWIETLEKFSRGNYASPIGWVDSEGRADFRVAIRGARYFNNKIEFTAGSGIVKGSNLKAEVEEIKLKLHSVVRQIS